jgi:hypothetical protein
VAASEAAQPAGDCSDLSRLRCDRSLPTCSNCLCRPEVGACIYSFPASQDGASVPVRAETTQRSRTQDFVRAEGDNVHESPPDASSQTLQEQVNRLEKVLQQITASSTAAHPELTGSRTLHIQDALQHLNNKGILRTGVTRMATETPNSSPIASSDAGEALWVTLLSDLVEKKGWPQRADQSLSPQTPSQPTSLFSSSQNVPMSAILLHVPSRFICDQILAIYFSSKEPTSCLLHRQTFQDQYATFWQQPMQTPVMWVALLLGVIRIVVGAWVRDGNEPPELRGKCSDLATLYHDTATACLAHADYARPQNFLLEALCLHLYVEYSATRDFSSSVWVQHSLIIRLSLRLGFHLNPDTLQDLTPFQAEMRRRIWAYIRQADILCSFQIGLPSVHGPRWLDEDLPRNLDDTDFDQRSIQLPVSRPNSQITSVSYLIAKTRLVLCLARALAAVNQDDNMTYERALYFDGELRRSYQVIPMQYQVQELVEPDFEDPMTGLRLVLGAVYHKALCIIHSKFLKAATMDQQYLYSWRVCTDSAMTMMKFQECSHQLPRGSQALRYHHSLTTHDFFLAATMLCTALLLLKGESSPASSICATVGSGREDMLEALEKSILIFNEGCGESFEARRASQRLSAIANELRSGTTRTNSRRVNNDILDRTSGPSSQNHSRMLTAGTMSEILRPELAPDPARYAPSPLFVSSVLL